MILCWVFVIGFLLVEIRILLTYLLFRVLFIAFVGLDEILINWLIAIPTTDLIYLIFPLSSQFTLKFRYRSVILFRWKRALCLQVVNTSALVEFRVRVTWFFCCFGCFYIRPILRMLRIFILWFLFLLSAHCLRLNYYTLCLSCLYHFFSAKREYLRLIFVNLASNLNNILLKPILDLFYKL